MNADADQPPKSPVRDLSRIENIVTPSEARIAVTVETAAVGRAIRKDFHILTAKMHLARRERRKALEGTLYDFCQAVVEAELAALPYRREYAISLETRRFELRIVSPQASALLRSLLRLDAVNAMLVKAETRGALTRHQRMAIVHPPLGALFSLKALALDLPLRAPRGRESAESEAA